VPQPDPKWRELVETARTAYVDGRLEEASAAVAAAKAILENEELRVLREQIADALAAREAAEREKRRAQVVAVLEVTDRLHSDSRYDEALEKLRKVRGDHADFADLIDPKIARTEEVRREAAAAVEEQLKKTRETLESRKFSEALRHVQIAQSLQPEREDLRAFMREIQERHRKETMVYILGSEAILGSDTNEDEKPKRKVSIPSFYLDRTEVTNDDYLAFCRATRHAPPPTWARAADGSAVVPAGLESHPVAGVSVQDAEAYAVWAGKRLPTEEEWEKAARWIDGRTFPWGESFKESELEFRCNSYEYGVVRASPGGVSPFFATTAAGSMPSGASPYGLQDLAGNVWEWTSAIVEKDGVKWRVLKGGSFMTPKDAVRSSNRLLEDPEMAHHDAGFRCAMDAPKSEEK
jgi:formylglycine-generating enzyme required for sulfatase activity